MAITTFSELKTSIASWLARSDLTTTIPDFITLFEATANRRLRTRQMLTSTTLTPSSGAATLPTDYVGWKTVIPSGFSPLEYKDPEWLRAAYTTSATDTPLFFTIEGTSLVTRPATDQNIAFSYYQKVPVLSDSNTTNWLLTAHPDLYLFGSLVEANAFTIDANAAALWKARRDELFDEIEVLDQKFRGPAAVTVTGYTP